MKKVLTFLLIVMLITGTFTTVSAEEITIFLNGNQLITDVAPVFINDRVLVPVRAIFEALGAEVSWDEENFIASGKRTGIEVVMPIDSNVYTRNGKEITLDVPATLINKRTMVPVRAVAESFNCHVEWIEDINAVSIITDNLNVGAITDFPPFCYKDENGEIKGKDIELIVEISDRLNLSPVFTEYEFVEGFNSLDNEKSHIIVSGIAIDENRTKLHNCSDSYYHSKQIIVSKEKVDIENISDQTIGVLSGSIADAYVKLNLKNSIVKVYEKEEQMEKALKEGEVNCLVGNEEILLPYAEGYKTSIFLEEDFGIYISTDYEELKNEINRVIGELKEEGKLDEIFGDIY